MSDPGSREQVLEALRPLGAVMARPELGGTGLLLNGTLFGVLHSGLVYLKVDKGLREEYHAAGMRVLEPRPKQKLDAFLQVPLAVVEDSSKLLEHAARAAGRAVPKVEAKPPAKPRSAGATSAEEAPKQRSAGRTRQAAEGQASKPARTARGKADKTSS